MFVGGVFFGFGIIDDGNGFIYSFDLVIVGVGSFELMYIFIIGEFCIFIEIWIFEVFVVFMVIFIVFEDLDEDVGV